MIPTIKNNVLLSFLAFLLIMFGACSGDTDQKQTTDTENNGLTAFELQHGIGPVTEEVELGEFKQEMADRGRQIFQMKCEACHMADTRIVGPPLGDVLERRSPAFVMNMILNPGEMTREHPEGIKLMQEYMAPMPFQNVTVDDARAIVEYLRIISDE
ncbi:MAG: c-type cytochrome [Balneolaceae bacterium]